LTVSAEINTGAGMANVSRPPRVSGLSDLASSYGFAVCDVWGVLHNGVEHFRDAGTALVRFRERGGRVILVSNAPRPHAVIRTQLDRFGVDHAAYDDIITSGDVARDFLAARPNLKVFPIGAERDLPVYSGLPVTLVGESEAEIIACTGLVDDDKETPDDYVPQLKALAERRLPMLCINPDIVVERGDRLIWCAGALAQRYRLFGGETIVVGKPFAPIYDAALRRFTVLAGKPVDKATVLAIGDGAETDVRGGRDAGIDVLFITGGIHTAVFGPRERPRADAVAAFLADAGLAARAFVPRLVW
jgi:HAD superfamily hydrolase (TIGR01459 family)